MILKFFQKIILRLFITLGILLGSGLYLGNLAGGNPSKMLELVQAYLTNKTVLPKLSAAPNQAGVGAIGELGDLNDLLKLTPQASQSEPQIPVYNTPVQPVLKADEAKNDQLNPRDNPSDWDYISSKSQKCWFHKRTRKKVCEPLSATP